MWGLRRRWTSVPPPERAGCSSLGSSLASEQEFGMELPLGPPKQPGPRCAPVTAARPRAPALVPLVRCGSPTRQRSQTDEKHATHKNNNNVI